MPGSADGSTRDLKRTDEAPEPEVFQSTEIVAPPLQNIPYPEYQSFVGRERYVTEITTRLKGRHFIISIDGFGGVGKTALAHQVATRCWKARDFDAIIWISAKNKKLLLTGIEDIVPSLTSYDDLLNQVSRVLGFPNLVQLPIEQKEKEVYKLITNLHCLIVVDNLETVDDQRINDFLKELPEPTKALITSRSRLGEVERIVHLPEMQYEETADLVKLEIESKKNKSSPIVDEKTIKEIHLATGGIPLAIKWLVGLVVEGVPLEQMVSRLRASNSPVLEFCFRETFDRVLTYDSKALFMIMPIFPEEPSRAELSAASGLEGERLDKAILQLVTLSLINERSKPEPDGSITKTYGILPLTLSFAQTELSKNRGLEKDSRKALGEYLQLHTTMKKAALQYGYTLEDLGATSETGRAAALLANLAFAAYQRGAYKDSLGLFRRAVDTNPRLSYTYQLWAIVERQEGNFGRASELFEEAARLNPHNPMIWRAWSSMKAETGAIDEARQLAQQGLKENPRDKGNLHNLAVNESRSGNYERAEKLFEETLYSNPLNYQELRHNIVTYGAKAENYRRWGVSMENSIMLEEAKKLYLKGLETIRNGLRIADREWKLHEIQIRLNRNLGELELKMGDLDQSDRYFQGAFFYRPSQPWQLRHNSEVCLGLAELLQRLGLPEKALEVVEVGLRDWPANTELRRTRDKLLRGSRGHAAAK